MLKKKIKDLTMKEVNAHQTALFRFDTTVAFLLINGARTNNALTFENLKMTIPSGLLNQEVVL